MDYIKKSRNNPAVEAIVRLIDSAKISDNEKKEALSELGTIGNHKEQSKAISELTKMLGDSLSKAEGVGEHNGVLAGVLKAAVRDSSFMEDDGSEMKSILSEIKGVLADPQSAKGDKWKEYLSKILSDSKYKHNPNTESGGGGGKDAVSIIAENLM